MTFLPRSQSRSQSQMTLILSLTVSEPRKSAKGKKTRRGRKRRKRRKKKRYINIVCQLARTINTISQQLAASKPVKEQSARRRTHADSIPDSEKPFACDCKLILIIFLNSCLSSLLQCAWLVTRLGLASPITTTTHTRTGTWTVTASRTPRTVTPGPSTWAPPPPAATLRSHAAPSPDTRGLFLVTWTRTFLAKLW